MNKKQLYYALGGKKTRKALAKAEQEFLDTLPYDEGTVLRRGKLFDKGGWWNTTKDIFKTSFDNMGKDTNALAAISTATPALFDGIQAITNAKTYEDVKNQRDNYNRSLLTGISDNDALMQAASNLSYASYGDYDPSMFGGQDVSEIAGNTLSAAANGVMTTKSPWGALFGVIPAGAGIFRNSRANKEVRRANADIPTYNRGLNAQLASVAENVDMKNDRLALQAMMNDPFFALGGETRTHGSDFTNGLTFINEGGSHEENPNEGVQVGVDEEGTPNLVEEGESIWNNDYVFSKRLKVPTEISTKYKLGGDMSFADAVEKLTRESRVRPNDPISNATNNIILAELRDSQEQIRGRIQQEAAQKYAEAYNQDALLQSLAGMNGMMSPQEGGIEMQMPQQGQEMMPPGFAFGGNLFVQGGDKNTQKSVKQDPTTGAYVAYAQDGTPYIYSTFEEAVEQQNKLNEVAAAKDTQKRRQEAAEAKAKEEARQAELKRLDAAREQRNQERRQREQTATREAVTARAASTKQEAQSTKKNQIQRRQIGTRADGSPRYQYAVMNQYGKPQTFYSLDEAVAFRDSNAFKNANGEWQTSDGKTFKTQNEAFYHQYTELALKNNQNNKQPSTRSNSSTATRSTETTQNFNDKSQGPAKTADSSDLPDPKVVAQRKAAAEEYKKAAGDKFSQTKYNDIASGKTAYTPSKSSSGQTGQGNPDWIPYDKKINGKDYEAQEDYQNFIKYMDSIRGTKEAQDWIDHINEEIAKTGSKRRIKDFDDWRQLALDGKVGPVHEYTIKAAAEFKQNVDKRKADAPKLEAPTNLKEVPTGATAEKTPEIQFPESNYSGDKVTYDQPTEEENGLHPATVASGVQSLIDTFTTPDFSNADAVIDEARKIGTPINIPVETIGNYRRRNPFDEKYLVNMANANRAAALRSMDNTTGGNQGARLANVLNYFNQRDLGEVARQAYLANRADDAQVAEFNRGTDLQNMAAINQRNATQAQLNSHRQQAAFNGIAHGYSMRQNIQDRWDQNSGLTQSTFIQNLENEDKNRQILNALNFILTNRVFGTGENPWTGSTNTAAQPKESSAVPATTVTSSTSSTPAQNVGYFEDAGDGVYKFDSQKLAEALASGNFKRGGALKNKKKRRF